VGEIGVGASASAFSETLLAWFLGETRLLTPVDGGVFDAVRVGAGPSAGLRVLLGDSATWLTTGRAHYLPMQTPKVTWEASSSFRIHYLKDFALSLESNVQPDAWSAEAVSFLYF
jgi:hypothetical protein